MRRGSSLRAFTLAETLVNLALLVFFVGALGALVFEGRAFAVGQDRRAQLVRDREALVAILPTLCQSVRPAPWASPDSFSVVSGTLVAAHWEGKKDNELRLKVQDGVLVAECPRGRWEWRSLDNVKVEWWKSNGRTIGLVVRWTEAAEPRALTLPWGSQAL